MSISAAELAGLLNLPLLGDGTRPLDSAAAVEEAGPQQLAFVGNPKFFAAGQSSLAGCLIAHPDYAAAAAQAVIVSPRPRAHFAQALAFLYPPLIQPPGIHPTAVIEPGAEIHLTASIGPLVTVGRGSVIGAYTALHARVTVYHRVTVGQRCIVHAGAVIGADGFGFELVQGTYQKIPQVGTVQIGDDVEIGANTCIDRAALGATVIGDGTKLDNMVHIAHNCRIGRHVVIAAQTGLAGGVVIGDYAVVGGQVGIGDKARIEAGAIIGSGAGVLTSKIVRTGEPVWGTPARPLRQYLAQLATLARLTRTRKR